MNEQGTIFIAGYNTSRKDEKEKYNIKMLGKVVGSGFGVITLITAFMVLFDGNLPSIFAWLNPWGILGTIGLMVLLGNTICKNRIS